VIDLLMSSRRTQRIAEAIREVVASSILFEVADPRVRGVTVLSASVSPDLRHAKVHVSIMGSETERKLALRGLEHAAGFLQAKVAARLQTKTTPHLSFHLDEAVRKTIELTRLIEETREQDRALRGEPLLSTSEVLDANSESGPEGEDQADTAALGPSDDDESSSV
jgi:ribosome-binding factor A